MEKVFLLYKIQYGFSDGNQDCKSYPHILLGVYGDREKAEAVAKLKTETLIRQIMAETNMDYYSAKDWVINCEEAYIISEMEVL